jgi:hypothetical protein
MGALLLFIFVGNVAQLQAYALKVNLELLYIVGLPASLGVLFCGGLYRGVRGKPAYYWLAFFLWIAASFLASNWKSHSLRLAFNFLRTELVLMFVIAGLAVTWNDCRKLIRAVFWGAMMTVMTARFFQREAFDGDRFQLEFGSFGNSNDFAALLLFCIPFIYLGLISSKAVIVKLACFGMCVYSLKLILDSASRGALLALGVTLLLLFLWATSRQRIAIAAGVPLLGLGLMVAVPDRLLHRMTSFSAGQGDASQEAIESANQRKYLLGKSIEYTLKFPVLGIGLGQFPEYEGTNNKVFGTHGAWQGTHNSFTQVSSECGIPALMFYVAALAGAFRLLYRTHREARKRPDCQDIRDVSMVLMLSFAGYMTAATFLNLAYAWPQNVLIGFALAVSATAKREFERRGMAGSEPDAGKGSNRATRESTWAASARKTLRPGNALIPLTGSQS